MKISGKIISVKAKVGAKGGAYHGITFDDKDGKRFWFGWYDTATCPDVGNDIIVEATEGDKTEDGKMTFLKDVDILDAHSDCDHEALIRESRGRYKCSDCDVIMRMG